jgi:hypothetical protein
MGDINFKNRIKNYFKFLYKNIKYKTNLDECINCTRELNSDIKNQIVLYGGRMTPDQSAEFTKSVTELIESYKKPFPSVELSFKDPQKLLVDTDGKFDPKITEINKDGYIDQYISVLDPANNILLDKKNLEDIKEKIILLSNYLNFSLNYIYESESKSDNGELSAYVKTLNKADLERLSKELEDFIQSISKLADLKIPKKSLLAQTADLLCTSRDVSLVTLNDASFKCDTYTEDFFSDEKNKNCINDNKVKRDVYRRKCSLQTI